MPDDDVEPSSWLRSEPDGEVAVPVEPASPPSLRAIEPIGGRVLPLFAIAGPPNTGAATIPAAMPAPPDETGVEAATPDSTMSMAPVVELPLRDAAPSDDGASAPVSPPGPSPEAEVVSIDAAKPAVGDDWARWEALAEEIRMQVLQRIDIFTDTGLREQLSVQMQPIVDRASAEMVATINEQVGTLLRAYIAEAIEREIEKWRKGNT